MEPRSPPIQTTSSQSPASQVTEEILWLVFLVNTEAGIAPFPLDTARRSSQVCRRWRSILLNASSIWGRLMDWRALNQESDEWRNEILRRSGTSVLWVTHPTVPDPKRPTRRGCRISSRPRAMKANKSTLLFFEKLIVDNWERVEILSPFQVYGEIENFQALVQRRAPNLQVFTLPHLRNQAEYHGDLFLNHAPRLHNFCSRTHCKLDIRWMSNLRTLNLSLKFNNQEVCNVLAHMPYLESLTLQGRKDMQDCNPPPIHLPLLRTLVLRGCLMYLRNLVIPPITTLKLLGSDTTDQGSHGSCIASTLDNHFSEVQPTLIYLCLDPDNFTISNRSSLSPIPPKDIYLEIRLTQLSKSYGDKLERILDILASPRFSTVTTLIVQCDELENRSQSCHRSFQQFLEHFSEIDTLQIHEKDIYILMQYVMTITDSETLLFPLLQYLVVTGFDFFGVFDQGYKYKNGPTSGSIEKFIELRKRLGVPIQVLTLDLTTPRYSSFSPPARSLDPSLEQFAGMKVVWKWKHHIVEYDCGSGNPEYLQVEVDNPLVPRMEPV